MDPLEYERMYQVEAQHWWYRGMETITRAILNRYVATPNLKILDAGCGTGVAITTYLADYGAVIGIDVSPLALKLTRQRNLSTLALASVMEIPFKSDSFDLVTSFDVLYERAVTSDVTALSEFFRILRPGGYALLRLPAYDWLRGQHDVSIHTARRYTKKRVAKLFTECGFSVLHVTYANTFLFPLAVAKRLLERIWPPNPNSSDLSVDMGVFNGLFKFILGSEALLASHFSLPFGLSVIALGYKPKSA